MIYQHINDCTQKKGFSKKRRRKMDQNAAAYNNTEEENIKEVVLSDAGNKPVVLNFDGGSLTSDAGALLLRETEERVGIIRKMAEVIPDARDPRYTAHTVADMLGQRVFQIACGYEDANDCDSLRDDPLFKMLAGRLPETGDPLASRPTMSRFENSLSRADLYRLAIAFADVFIASYETPPPVIIIDADDTEDKVFGTQQQSLFNGYYGDRCFMPLHIYEGLSGRLITTVLKPGKRCDGEQMLSIIKRLVSHLQQHWPHTLMIFRGDSRFAYPEVTEWLESHDNTAYITGMTSNPRLMKEAEITLSHAAALYGRLQTKVTLYHSFYYQADSWTHPRRTVAKAEFSEHGKNIRFVVTDMENAKASVLYKKIYCARGEDGLYIKDHKLYLKSDRTSCHRFGANQFRLFLHSAAYVLIHSLKTELPGNTPFAGATFETIRTRLLKIGARVRELKTRIKVELPSSYPLKDILVRCFRIFECLRSSE
jgi:hypothetical protein